jgi:hypothetical protein
MGGTITSGAGRGRTLGFPTANLAPDRELLIPKGVYGCLAHVDGVAHQAVVNIGVRPTFAETTLAIEAHLLDFTGDLYGRRMRLDFLLHLREEMRFPSVDELRAQIARDVAAARAGLAPRCLYFQGTPWYPSVLSADKTKFFWNPPWGCVSGTRRLEETPRWHWLSTARRA